MRGRLHGFRTAGETGGSVRVWPALDRFSRALPLSYPFGMDPRPAGTVPTSGRRRDLRICGLLRVTCVRRGIWGRSGRFQPDVSEAGGGVQVRTAFRSFLPRSSAELLPGEILHAQDPVGQTGLEPVSSGFEGNVFVGNPGGGRPDRLRSVWRAGFRPVQVRKALNQRRI